MCTTASDIRNCVIGNIRQMDKVRKDMKQFKEFIESRNIFQMARLKASMDIICPSFGVQIYTGYLQGAASFLVFSERFLQKRFLRRNF